MTPEALGPAGPSARHWVRVRSVGDFTDLVLGAAGPVLLHVHRGEVSLLPIVAATAAPARLVCLDLEQHPDVLRAFDIPAAPALLLYRAGQVVPPRTRGDGGHPPEATGIR
jgi:hypothetical protein